MSTEIPTVRMMRSKAGQDALALMALQSFTTAFQTVVEEPVRAMIAIANSPSLSHTYATEGLNKAMIALAVNRTMHLLHSGNVTDVVDALDSDGKDVAQNIAVTQALLGKMPALTLGMTDKGCIVIDENAQVTLCVYDPSQGTLTPMIKDALPFVLQGADGNVVTIVQQRPNGIDASTARKAIVRVWKGPEMDAAIAAASAD